MSNSELKFQCFLCFSINTIDKDDLGHQHTCSNCEKVVQLPNSSFSSGRVIANDFVLKKKLGSGAMGSVFLAHQLSMDRQVALKLLFYQYTKDERFANEFTEEAKAAARLNHINIVQSFAFGSDHDILYLAMNYISGETLAELLERYDRMELDDALNVVQQIAEGLHAAWVNMKLIHRDIKPANILMTENGVAKISDFGLARKETDDTSKVISGSPAYMSPEQFANKSLDCRSDIYALGITLFELLTGKLPFTGKNVAEVAYKHLNTPVPVTKMTPSASRPIKSLIKKMTAKRPDDRFQTPEELVVKIIEIRKKISVDQSQVSSVHTMSMKKHRYNNPKHAPRASKIKTLVEYHDSAIGNKKEKEKSQSLMIAIFILTIIFFFMFYIYSYSLQGANSRKMVKEVNTFSSNIKVLDNEADKRHIALIKLFNQLTKNVGKNTGVSEQLSKDIATLKTKTDSRNNKITDFIKDRGNSKEAVTVLVNTKLKEIKLKENTFIEEYRAQLWHRILRMAYIKKFNAVSGLIYSEKMNGPSWNKDWLTLRESELFNIFTLIHDLELISATELIGTKLSIGSIIAKSATNKTFLIKTSSAEPSEKIIWYNLPKEDLKLILTKGWHSEVTLDDALKDLSFYTGDSENQTKHRKSQLNDFFERYSDELKRLEYLGEDVTVRKESMIRDIVGLKCEQPINEKFKNYSSIINNKADNIKEKKASMGREQSTKK